MRKGWETKRISEIAMHSLGKMLDKAKNLGEPKPYLRNINVRWGEFDLSDLLEMRFLLKEAEKYTAVKGDVLVCEGGYPGRAAIWDRDEPIYFQKALHRVRFHEPERNKWFVYYLQFRDLEGTLRKHFNGAGIQHFTGEALAQFEIPVPPLSEQQRIVGILDEAFGGLASAQAHAAQNLQNARDLFESHLNAVFTQRGEGWVEKSLGEVADLLDCLHKTPIYAETGFPMVRVTDIKPGFLDLSKTRKVDEQTFKAFSKGHNPKAGDIVFSRVGSCGVSALVNSDEPFCLGQNTVFILPKINSVLLYHYLNSPHAKEQFKAFIDGTTQPTISMKSIRQVAVPIAPPAEHDGLVAKLDSMREETQRLESIYQRKLAVLAELKKSLLHQAFNGEL